MLQRPRRNRQSESLRKLVQESQITLNDLIAPLFVTDLEEEKRPIDSMPGQFRFNLKALLREVQELSELGIKCISLFPVIDESHKDSQASYALDKECFYYQAIKEIKNRFPHILVMTDIALDPYSSDGHDGLVCPTSKEILNDETLEVLSQMAILQARAGSDIVGPSDMMDGRVLAIRKALDGESYKHVNIMSYTAKYASSFYGPFRDALNSAPKEGDKKTYQMNPANTREALIEAELDIEEGADILMVKPGLAFLDVISEVKKHTNYPVAAYNVSGEYAMVMAADEKGWLDADAVMMECMLSFKRAGADMVLSYFSKRVSELLR